jgi:hypothetical protein
MEREGSRPGELEYNQKISEREKHNPRHRKFIEWCFDNGFKWAGVDFPAYFGLNGELRGIVTTREIRPYEAIMAVPNKLLITSIKAKEDKHLSKIISAHEELFDIKDENGEYNILIAFLLKERAKGTESFYFPFLNLVPEIESGLVWDKETINFIQEAALKEEALDAQRELKEEYQAMKEVLEKYPNMFPNLTLHDFAWASQFVTTRCFGWFLPCTLLAPMVDLINHYANEQCTTEIAHMGLEMEESKQKRENLDYRKLRGNYDMKLLIPESNFTPGNRKTNAIHFIESFGHKVNDFQHMREEDEHKEAIEVASKLFNDHPEIDIWNLPNWELDCNEDNDSSDKSEDVEEEEFFGEVSKLKELLLTTEPQPQQKAQKRLSQDQIATFAKANEEKRKEVMNFEIGKTQTPSDYEKQTKDAEEEMNSLDESDSFESYQKDFPWYTSSDKEIYFIVANNRNKYIPKNSELKVSYGSRTNRYLTVWYGFALTDNFYDSYTFRFVVDEKVAKGAGLTHGVLTHFITTEERQKGFVTVNGYIISTELITVPFKAKYNEFHMNLVVFLRGHMYTQWLKEHPNKKKSSKFTISVPFDLSYEVAVLKRFIDIFTVLQLNFSRGEIEDEKLLTSGNLSGPKRAIVVCEMGWKKIIAEQIRLGKLVLEIVRQVKADPSKKLRSIYMEKMVEVDKPGENPIIPRLKIRNYLKRFLLSPALIESK